MLDQGFKKAAWLSDFHIFWKTLRTHGKPGLNNWPFATEQAVLFSGIKDEHITKLKHVKVSHLVCHLSEVQMNAQYNLPRGLTIPSHKVGWVLPLFTNGQPDA